MNLDDVKRLSRTSLAFDAHCTTRGWIRAVHQRLEPMLPLSKRPTLLTEDLVDEEGQAIDVFNRLNIFPDMLVTAIGNAIGLGHTAQAVGAGLAIDHPAPPWEGFDEIRIPIANGIFLTGRIGLVRDEQGPVKADCIVILGGIFGDNGTLRTRDLSLGLHRAGYHVLALELRGAGQVEATQPEVAYTFGVQETGDLMVVSEWLEAFDCVNRTGLIGYCWGGNEALLAAWFDGRPEDDPAIYPELARHLPPRNEKRHFTAGVIALSPVLRWEEMRDKLDSPWNVSVDPVLHGLQNTIRNRKIRKGYPESSGNLHKLIQFEFRRSDLRYEGGYEDGVRFLRFLPYKNKGMDEKLDWARMPVLIVHAANDPLGPVQDVADLIAGVDNPNVAALVLPGGGHVGFAPFAKDYQYSLFLNFFDPEFGAAAATEPAKTPSQWVNGAGGEGGSAVSR
jgi:predicted alpha/beta-fold hydrolase